MNLSGIFSLNSFKTPGPRSDPINITQFNKKKINKPSITICHTIKGKGFYFAENNPNWHHKNNLTEKEIKELNYCLQ